jgi:thioredoxin 2
MATQTVRCEACGQLNWVPAAAQAKPRSGKCKAFLSWIADAGDDDFAEIAESTVPVLMDLWATWCGPCRMVSPRAGAASQGKAGQLKLVKVDIDRAPKLAQRCSVQSVPTLMVLYRGEVIARQLAPSR